MHKKVLTEVDLYTGEISMPKGFEIDRDKIRNDIIESFIKQNRVSTNSKDYSFDDYVVPYSQPLQWMQDYIRDHWRVEYGSTLVQKNMHGNVMHPINVRDTSRDQFGWWNAYAGYVVTSDLQKGLLSAADQTLADRDWNKVSPLNSNFAVCAYPTVKFTVIGYPFGYRSEGLGGNNPTIKLNPAF